MLCWEQNAETEGKAERANTFKVSQWKWEVEETKSQNNYKVLAWATGRVGLPWTEIRQKSILGGKKKMLQWVEDAQGGPE